MSTSTDGEQLSNKRMSYALYSPFNDVQADQIQAACFFLDKDTNLCEGQETLVQDKETVTWAGVLRGVQRVGTKERVLSPTGQDGTWTVTEGVVTVSPPSSPQRGERQGWATHSA